MNSEGEIHSQLLEFGTTLVDTLSAHLTDEGRLIDPKTGNPVPDDHYANTCFAVAAFRAGGRADSPRYRQSARKCLQYYLDLDSGDRGHGEFNALAILELIQDARNGRYELPISETQLLDTIDFESSIDSREGNNWLLLRGLCHYRLADLFGRRRDKLTYIRIQRIFRHWIQEDGMIADAPRFPIAPIETPITYHAKLATLCAHLGVEADDQWLEQTAIDAFRVLATATLPSGEALYYGRSENTLFGYATAIDGTFRLQFNKSWMAELRYQLASFLFSNFDPKLANCQPGGRSACSVDDYIWDGVYSAYAAMVLLGLPQRTTAVPDVPHPGSAETLETAGLTTVVGRNCALGFAGTGQIVFTEGFPDPRYAGLTPLSFVVDGTPICPGVPGDFIANGIPPYLPVVTHGTDRYVPVVWSSQQSKDRETFTVTGDGFYNEINTQSNPEKDSSSDRQQSKMEGIVRSIGRKAKIPLYIERRRKRPAKIPAAVRRAIHFISDLRVLIVQTGTAIGSEWEVTPTSCVVTPEYEEAATIEFDDAKISTVTETVHTPQGCARWIQPDCSSDTERHWSTVVIDPDSVTEDLITTQREHTINTTVRTSDRSLRHELSLPCLPSNKNE